MLPRKSFKIKDPRLAKNAFPEISARKKLNKNESARSIALQFGRFRKNCLLAWGAMQLPLLPPASNGPGDCTALSKTDVPTHYFSYFEFCGI